MAWLDVDGIKEKFSIQSERYIHQIEAASQSAALILRRGMDADIYDEAIATTAPSDVDNLIRYESVIESHSYLTMWFLIGNVGNKLVDAGFVKAAQDAASPAMNGRVITNSYLTPAELAAMKADFLERAKTHLGSYGTIIVDIETVGAAEQSLYISSLRWF
jgi:hypothetical protein